ncbi:MAG TPA: serine/threonine-protein kinase [Ktedonobacterales bacterium]|nr:serine/threonine-protein kinase [Ktedonobacterales bacterium]
MAGLEGQILGGCRIIKRLGAGGMGQVYLAEQVRLGREVALKVVRPPRSGSADDGNAPTLADAPERFKLEARAIAALEHPNILPVHEFGTENELMYLVMPLMPDGSLFDAMRPGGPNRRLHLPLTPAQAAPLVFQAASALQYAHQHNIIHRDVKPENFLVRVGRDGALELFLADFGLVKEYHPESDTNTLAVGTADYVAPEQIEGHPVPASDQYALAVMTYELLAGRLPFTGAVAEVALKHLREEPPPPRRFNPAIPEGIEQVILRAMRKKPQERWPSVMEYARAYSEVLKKLDQQKQGSISIEDEPTVHIPPSAAALPSVPSTARPPAAYETQAVPFTPPSSPAHPSRPPQSAAPAAAPARPAPHHPPQGYGAVPPGPGAPSWGPGYQNSAAGAPPGWKAGPASGRRGFPVLRVVLIVVGIVILVSLAVAIVLALSAPGPAKNHAAPGHIRVLHEQPVGTSFDASREAKLPIVITVGE